MIIAIFAVDEAGGFSFNGRLPWHDPEDLGFFKRTTDNHIIVMGSSTFDSIGRKLPNRESIVLSSKEESDYPNRTNGAAVSILKDLERERNNIIFVIGGKSVLLQSLPVLDGIILTTIRGVYPADCWIDTKSFVGNTPMSAIKFKKVMEQDNEKSMREFYIRN